MAMLNANWHLQVNEKAAMPRIRVQLHMALTWPIAGLTIEQSSSVACHACL